MKLYQKRPYLAGHVDLNCFGVTLLLNIISKKMFRQICSYITTINQQSVIPALSTHTRTHTPTHSLTHTDSVTQTCIYGNAHGENTLQCVHACIIGVGYVGIGGVLGLNYLKHQSCNHNACSPHHIFIYFKSRNSK